MGHVVMHVERLADVMKFYQEVLEFKLSDYWLRPFPGYFFHVNPRHHSIALVESGKNMVHHMMLELFSLDDVGQGYDLALKDEERIAVSLGRHSGDYVTSFYTWNPSGFMVEYGWGGQAIDDSTWKPFERKHGPSLWGHDRKWMSPEKREESRQLCIESAEAGLRQPVQVIEGNYNRHAGRLSLVGSMKAQKAVETRNNGVVPLAKRSRDKSRSFGSSVLAQRIREGFHESRCCVSERRRHCGRRTAQAEADRHPGEDQGDRAQPRRPRLGARATPATAPRRASRSAANSPAR